ncbi:MAG TPA: hypothetical protein DEH78_10805, partial [Solibacterales bacterium]|nr:hypothetical protein [Bryobacterales bacterium]
MLLLAYEGAVSRHTYLLRDTQIYVPLLLHERNPSLLRRDLIIGASHLPGTVLDELLSVAWNVSGLPLDVIHFWLLALSHLLLLGGVYVFLRAQGADRWDAMACASVSNLGLWLAGPRLYVLEPEAIPRAVALSTAVLAVGCLASGRRAWAAAATAATAMVHPPTALPLLLIVAASVSVRVSAVVVGTGAMASLAFAWHVGYLTPEHFAVLEYRTPYVLVSKWKPAWIVDGCLYATTAAALLFFGCRGLLSTLRWSGIALCCMALVALPVSYLALERMRLGVVPVLQPLRLLLAPAVVLVLTAPYCLLAVARRSMILGIIGFLLLFRVQLGSSPGEAVVGLFSLPAELLQFDATVIAASAAVALLVRRARWPMIRLVTVLCVTGILLDLRESQPAPAPRAEIEAIAAWARAETPVDAVFAFPDWGQDPAPGMFRVMAERAVYVDWRAGGQVNYFPRFALEWHRRMERQKEFFINSAAAAREGVDYLVF